MPIPPKFAIQAAQWTWKAVWLTLMSQLAPSDRQGSFQRVTSQFRQQIGSEEFPAEANRYRLYIGLTCPWAHRVALTYTLKGLDDCIDLQVAIADVSVGGWHLENDPSGCRSMKSLYRLAQAGYKGRCSVPVLWDCQTQSIVNNESSEIIVLLNGQFNAWAKNASLDLYPPVLREEGDRLNELIYHNVNDGVYRCGFARTQAAYEDAANALFETLDQLDYRLGDRRYLLGEYLTLSDIRLFTTLIRFDWIYHGLFKCNRRRIRDYPNLWGYLQDIYQLPGVANTCPIKTIQQEYYTSLFPLNPSEIVPLGPDPKALLDPHGRS